MSRYDNKTAPWWDPNDPLEEGFRILARIILRRIIAQRAAAAEQTLSKSEAVTGEKARINILLEKELSNNGEISGHIQDK